MPFSWINFKKQQRRKEQNFLTIGKELPTCRDKVFLQGRILKLEFWFDNAFVVPGETWSSSIAIFMFRIFSAGEKTAWKLKCHQKVTFQKSVWKICWVTSCLGVVVGDYSFMRHDLAAAAATKLFQLVMYCIFLVYAFHEKSYKKEATNNSFFTLYLYWPKDSHLLNRVHDFKIIINHLIFIALVSLQTNELCP